MHREKWSEHLNGTRFDNTVTITPHRLKIVVEYIEPEYGVEYHRVVKIWPIRESISPLYPSNLDEAKRLLSEFKQEYYGDFDLYGN